MTDDTEVFIRKARTAIEAKGWAIYETRIKPTPEGNCLLELFKAGNRMAWGIDDRLMCWTEAYQKVTGSERSVTQGA